MSARWTTVDKVKDCNYADVLINYVIKESVKVSRDEDSNAGDTRQNKDLLIKLRIFHNWTKGR